MSEEDEFRDLMRRVRGGDPAAAEELVRRYESAVRRAVRFHLRSAGLGAALDSMDVCQSVLANFFVHAAAGAYEIDSPEHLIGLLVKMARNKLTSHARKAHAQRRDQRRMVGEEEAEAQPAGASSPSEQAEARDLLRRVLELLSPEERTLAQMRGQGHDWAAIAAHVGQDAQVLRKRLARALERIGRQVGLDDEP